MPLMKAKETMACLCSDEQVGEQHPGAGNAGQ